MADDDIGLDIGIGLDEDQFRTSYNKFLLDLNQDTKRFIQTAMDDMKGAAVKTWGSLPYYSMHQRNKGNVAASEAFIPGYAADLQKLGITPGSDMYNSALMSAAYKSSIPDAMQRRGLLLSQGRSAPSLNSLAERVMAVDYELMKQPWSREYALSTAKEGFKAEELEKLKRKELYGKVKELGLKGYSKARKEDLIEALVNETGSNSRQLDFDKMRERAVEEGIGKWTDPKKEHTAENFELIDKELDKIDKKSKKSKDNFNDWGHELKGALGTLTAIVGVVSKGVGLTLLANKVSEKVIEGAVAADDNRRAYLDMSVTDVMGTRVAGNRVGLGETAIMDEIAKLATDRQSYLTLGKGNPLYTSLAGIFKIWADTKLKPSEAYKQMANELYSNMQGMSRNEREKQLMLLKDAGFEKLASLVGAMLKNDKLAAQFGYMPSNLFTVLENPNREDAYNQAALDQAEIAAYKESIRASYAAMAHEWEEGFGKPFLGWWDKFLQKNGIKIAETAADVANAPKNIANGIAVTHGYKGTIEPLLRNALWSRDKVLNESASEVRNIIETYDDNVKYTGKYAGNFRVFSAPGDAKAGLGAWDALKKIKETADKKEAKGKELTDIEQRAQHVYDTFKEHGWLKIWENRVYDPMDNELQRMASVGLYSGDTKDFDNMVSAISDLTASKVENLNEILDAIKAVGDTAAKMEILMSNASLKAQLLQLGIVLPELPASSESATTAIDRSH